MKYVDIEILINEKYCKLQFALKNNIAGCYMQWFFYICSKNNIAGFSNF